MSRAGTYVRHPATRWFLVLCVALVLLRAALPYIVKDYVNRVLADAGNYRGHVEDIHIALWRGAYTIRGLELRQLDSGSKEPLLTSPRTELSILWSGLFEGAVVAKIKTFNARINFAAGGKQGAAQTGKGTNWGALLDRLTPFSIDTFEVVDSEVHYLDRSADPPVDIYLNHVNGAINNLTNRHAQSGSRVANLHAQALAMNQAQLDVDLNLDPYAPKPDFQLKARLLDLQAVRMKDFVRAYTLFDPKKGTLDVVVEATAKDGNVDGYVKPLFHDLELFSLKTPEKEANPLHFVADAVGSFFNLILQNQSKQQLATKVPFSGRVDDPNISISDTLVNLLRNAVVKAFTPEFDKSDKDKKN